nr:hypothetical protein [Lysinibacillus timonensis]
MTDKNDFDIYSNFNDKVPMRKKNEKALYSRNEEFGMEKNFEKAKAKNIESFEDWVNRMTEEQNK